MDQKTADAINHLASVAKDPMTDLEQFCEICIALFDKANETLKTINEQAPIRD